MTELFSFSFLAFSSFFTLVNPIEISPVFLSMMDLCDEKERYQITFKSVIIALIISTYIHIVRKTCFFVFRNYSGRSIYNRWDGNCDNGVVEISIARS